MVVPSFNCITCYNNRTAVAAPAAIRNSFAQIPLAQNLKATCQTWSIVNHKKLCICWPPTSAGNRERAFVTMEDHFARSDTSLSSKISPRKILTTSNHLRHVDSIANLPSGAGKIPRLNAVILGEALASEEDDLVFPNEDFSRQAHVSSPQEVLRLTTNCYSVKFTYATTNCYSVKFTYAHTRVFDVGFDFAFKKKKSL